MLITIYKNSLRYFDLHPKCIIKDGQPVALARNGYVVHATGPNFFGLFCGWFESNGIYDKEPIINDKNIPIKIGIYIGENGEFALSEDLFDDSFQRLNPHDMVCIKDGKISLCDYSEKDISFGFVTKSIACSDNVQYITILVTNIVMSEDY